jgi:16S rRNA (cytosine967-C5)-methyltransferase
MKADVNAPPAGLEVRQLAAESFYAVLRDQRTIEDVLGGEPRVAALEGRDRALLFALLLTTFRHLGEIDAVVAQHLAKPLPRKSGMAAAIIRLGAAQLLFLDTPPHAAIDLAVRCAKADRNALHFSGLVNAVLRKVAAGGTQSLGGIDAEKANTPDWLFERWSKTYGEDLARRIAAIHRKEPPLDLSVKTDPPAWAVKLDAALLPTGTLRLPDGHAPVPELEGFHEGAWWVQDAASAIPALLFGSLDGKSVLDLCAAPGGKTLQLCAAGATVTSVDSSPERLRRLQDNLARCGFEASVVTADVFHYAPAEPFDAVLLDAPCSATGTIRRHPELPYIKSPQQLGRLRSSQMGMLKKAAGFVRPGGTLVYCTCSLEPEEGEMHISRFLRSHPEFILQRPVETLLPPEFVSPEGWVRILPHYQLGNAVGMDGFFAAAMTRQA